MSSERVEKRKRGCYKKYNTDPTADIPRQTLWNWKKKNVNKDDGTKKNPSH